jgi:carboxyl-terminal processing protease
MPDKFVGLDTTEYSDLFRGLSRSGAMNTFSLNYVDANRKTIKENYPDLKTFINNFDVDEKMLAELFDLAAEQDTSINATQEDLALSKDLIEKRLKAMIAQNIWDQTAFYQIMNVKNEIFMKAYALLKENEYDLVNLHQN